ncbi:hypothetical protein FRC17_004896 [Serendipita sp. 399]|nr:hypothetical protein FRC17_004896 [Serendipita sp. 399]
MNHQHQMQSQQPHLHAPHHPHPHHQQPTLQHPHQQHQQHQQPHVLVSNNIVVFLAVAGLCGYTVYTTGNLQNFIYAVSALYVIRTFMRNPELVKQLHAQVQALQGHYYHRGMVPVATVSPARVSPRPSPLAVANTVAPAPAPAPVVPHPQEISTVPVHHQPPRLDTNFLDQVRPDGYQPLPARLPNIDEFEVPFTPIPSYSSSSYHHPAGAVAGTIIGSSQAGGASQRAPTTHVPSRTTSRSSGNNPAESYPPRNQPSRSLYDANINTLPNLANMTPAAAAAARVAAAVAAMRPDSRMSDFAVPIQNPYGSYSHYDAGTVNGQRMATFPEDQQQQQQQQQQQHPTVSEIIARPPTRGSPRANTISVSNPSSASIAKDEYVPKRKHRVPTMSARVGEVFAPGAGIAPPAPGQVSQLPPVKFFNSPLVNSPSASHSQQQQQQGYESDSSHVSSSPAGSRSHSRQSSSHGPGDAATTTTPSSTFPTAHARTESDSSLGLPTYEKHATTIVTLIPKRPGYIPQIQAILKSSRTSWLTLPGSVSHEVGHDDATGSVVIVETYETTEAMEDYEKSKQREDILDRLKTFIDESKTTVVRLPGSSAATRLIR